MRRTFLAAALFSFGAFAAPNPYLSQAKVFHQGLEFEKCLKRLDQAGKWDNSKAQLAEIELYSALCHLALGHEKEGRESFELALTVEPTLSLPPMQGPKVTALFEKAREKVVPPVVDPPPVEVVKVEPALVEDAPKRVELVPPTLPPTLVEAPPPQQRHLGLPIALGAVAVVGLAVGIVAGVLAKSAEGQANAAPFESDAVNLGHRANDEALVSNVGYGVGGAAAVGALIAFLLD